MLRALYYILVGMYIMWVVPILRANLERFVDRRIARAMAVQPAQEEG